MTSASVRSTFRSSGATTSRIRTLFDGLKGQLQSLVARVLEKKEVVSASLLQRDFEEGAQGEITCHPRQGLASDDGRAKLCKLPL